MPALGSIGKCPGKGQSVKEYRDEKRIKMKKEYVRGVLPCISKKRKEGDAYHYL